MTNHPLNLFVIVFLFISTACKSNDKGETPPPTVEVPTIDTLLKEGFERVRFMASDENFCNPERGFYSHLEWDNAIGNPTPEATFTSLRRQGYTLLLNIYYLSDYKEKDLDDAFLTLFQNQMSALRDNGFKVVLRFAYSKSQSHEGINAFDAPLEQAKKHIEQLKPILQANADVIAVLEAGFIGAWGEWYYTTNYGQGAFINWDKRTALVNALLDALPEDRMVCLRTPNYKLKILQLTTTDTLTVSEAYKKTSKARLAYHNDCFLASESDMGTFGSQAERTYNKADAKYVAMGGETCAVSDYSGCTNALEQLNAYHWSYLNINYRGEVINGWKQHQCFDSIQKSLGYRFVLQYLDKPVEIKKGENCTLKMLIKNNGFAAPYNPRLAYLLLTNSTNQVIVTHTMKSEPCYWFSRQSHLIEESIAIPADLPSGSYQLTLWMPDAAESIKDNPYYAIRLANQNVWQEEKGYNHLTTINIP